MRAGLWGAPGGSTVRGAPGRSIGCGRGCGEHQVGALGVGGAVGSTVQEAPGRSSRRGALYREHCAQAELQGEPL